MATWLIVPDEKLDDLADLNLINPSKQCTTKDTIDGVHLTGADKIGDSYWADYQTFLEGLEVFVGTPVWPAPEEETE